MLLDVIVIDVRPQCSENVIVWEITQIGSENRHDRLWICVANWLEKHRIISFNEI